MRGALSGERKIAAAGELIVLLCSKSVTLWKTAAAAASLDCLTGTQRYGGREAGEGASPHPASHVPRIRAFTKEVLQGRQGVALSLARFGWPRPTSRASEIHKFAPLHF